MALDFATIALAFLLVIIAFIAVEITLRAFPNVLPTQIKYVLILDYDKELLWKLKPSADVEYTNTDGNLYRVKTYPFETPSLQDKEIGFRDNNIPDSPEVVAFGDSFTFGDENSFEDTWPYALQSKLGKRVVNLGITGYSQLQEEAIARRYVSKLKPKVALLGFFANDYGGDYDFSKITPFSYRISFFGSNLLSVRWVKMTLLGQNENLKLVKYNVSGGDAQYLYNQEKTQEFFSTALPYFTEGGKLSRESVLRMREMLKGSRFIVLLIPPKEWHYRDILPYPDVEYNAILDTMRRHLEENNIEFIDAREGFEKARKEGKHIYTNHGSHLSREGNALLADIVSEHLKRNST